jgi:hypothetical protein
MAPDQAWCRVTIVGPGGSELGRYVLQGQGAPDLATVDAVAHMALRAKRAGGGLVLSEVSADLRELLELSGLSVEMQGEPELGKEPFGVQEGQEEGHLGDPAI